jgi:serine protease AprX
MQHAARIRWAEALRIRWTEALRIRWGIFGMSTLVSAGLLVLTVLVAVQLPSQLAQAELPAGGASLTELAASKPGQKVDVIVRFERGTSAAEGASIIRAAGGHVTRDLHIINGAGAELSAAAAADLGGKAGIDSVSLNGAVKPSAIDTSRLVTAYQDSTYVTKFWSGGGSLGTGVGVAVVDTGIQGDLPDFRVSRTDTSSRVIADAVVNPDAKTAGDKYGHGTHVAGLIAGNGLNRSTSDPLYGKYIGMAPAANLINVKASDDAGNASTLDVIDGLQFVVDHKNDFNIRVVNLSLNEAEPSSYKTSPLDAAAEAVWNAGIVVVAAAGNRGDDPDAVDYAPGNDPFVITVGGVDDQGTGNVNDDTLASWSSRGVTRDGYAKPDFSAPGAHMVSTLSPDSAITGLCSSCVVSGQYFRMGGTSMATAVVSGAVAALVGSHSSWTPNQIKSAIGTNLRYVSGTGYELNVASADSSPKSKLSKPNAYEPNSYINPKTGQIDYSRSSWSRSSWSRSSWSRSSWSRSSWSCTSCVDKSSQVDPSRSSWSRSSWSRSSWSASFSK